MYKKSRPYSTALRTANLRNFSRFSLQPPTQSPVLSANHSRTSSLTLRVFRLLHLHGRGHTMFHNQESLHNVFQDVLYRRKHKSVLWVGQKSRSDRDWKERDPPNRGCRGLGWVQSFEDDQRQKRGGQQLVAWIRKETEYEKGRQGSERIPVFRVMP